MGWNQDSVGGPPFPDFTGSGSPEGVITAAIGKSYVDTANGGFYFKLDGAGDTGWNATGAVFDGTSLGVGMSPDGRHAIILCATTSNGEVFLTDLDAFNNSGNGLRWSSGGSDGAQQFTITLGPDGEFETDFNEDGTTAFPGDVSMNGSLSSLSGTVEIDNNLFVDDAVTIAGGDATFTTADTGPVCPDQSDGHTYRLIFTNGVPSGELVT